MADYDTILLGRTSRHSEPRYAPGLQIQKWRDRICAGAPVWTGDQPSKRGKPMANLSTVCHWLASFRRLVTSLAPVHENNIVSLEQTEEEGYG